MTPPPGKSWWTAVRRSGVLEKESYDQAREFIMRSACLEYKTKQSELRFYNKRAKEAWERLMKYREEMRKKPQKVDPSFSLWNIIGAVTSRHPSLNLTNIWQLTVYQLYDQFARVRDQVAFDVLQHPAGPCGARTSSTSLCGSSRNATTKCKER